MGFRDSDFDPLDPFARREGVELELDATALPRPAATAPRREAPIEPVGPPARAVELAKYGLPPPLWLEGPYALAVLRRRRALRQRLPELRRVRDAAGKDLERAALDLGRAVHDERAHARAPELGGTLRRADAAKKLTAGHEAELARARSEARDRTLEIERSIEAWDRDARPLRARARELQAEVVVFQQDFEAASRAIHEATAALDALAREGGGDVNRRIELEATRTLRKADADAALREIDARTPELTAREAEAAALARSVAEARDEIAEVAAALARTEARVAREATSGREAYETALRELADEAIQRRLDRVIAPQAARKARVYYDTYASHARELEMHEIALTLDHPRSVRRGVVALIALAVGILGALVFLIVR